MDKVLLLLVLTTLNSFIASAENNISPLQLLRLLRCTRIKNPWKYLYYGCWCGPYHTKSEDHHYEDGFDRCCKFHDLCTERLFKKYGNLSTAEAYMTMYEMRCRHSRPICHHRNKGLGAGLCRCDRNFAVCMGEYQKTQEGSKARGSVYCSKKE